MQVSSKTLTTILNYWVKKRINMAAYPQDKSVILTVFLFFLSVPIYLIAQVLPDQIWLYGTNEFSGQLGYGNALLKFENGEVSSFEKNLYMNFESTMAVMPDSLGSVLFYTNGCYIANAAGDTMLNGIDINPGEMHDWTCPTSGYTSPLGAMILQMPGHANLYYLFHMGVKYGPERRLSYGPFYYTIIDMNLAGGKGAVISKNNIVSNGNLEPFVAVRHGNGRDWWLIFPGYGTNKYHKLLFSESGLKDLGEQEIGQNMSCRYIGSSAFSPNGIRYVRQHSCSVEVMDFDRCSGQFSNERNLPLSSNVFGGGGVAFSNNGNRLFVSTQLSIQSADLTQPFPVLDTIVGTNEVIGSSLHLMQYAPDGKIYLSNLGRGKFYHTINHPDDSGIDFKQRGLSLSNFSVRTLPNYPNYRLYDVPGSSCDTLGINAPTVDTKSIDDNSLIVWPNPVKDVLYIQSKEQTEIIYIFDSSGRMIYGLSAQKFGDRIVINVQNLPSGLYYFLFQTTGGVRAGKFVKE